MLNDRTRTSSFIEATRDSVRPGDVVVDIGTGTGILAIAAANAGARRVYAIEGAGVAGSARQLIEANGVADRVVLIRGWSMNVVLPELCDVLISETIGNDPLAEGILSVTRDAIRRFLKPHARLVPSGIELYGQPVTIAPEYKERFILPARELSTWAEWYGIDFSSLAETLRTDSLLHFVNPYEARTWTPLGPPTRVAHWQLKSLPHPSMGDAARMKITQSGVLDGVLFFFVLHSREKSFLTTAPDAVDGNNHWLSPLHVLSEPIEACDGDDFVVRYWNHPSMSGPRSRITSIRRARRASALRHNSF